MTSDCSQLVVSREPVYEYRIETYVSCVRLALTLSDLDRNTGPGFTKVLWPDLEFCLRFHKADKSALWLSLESNSRFTLEWDF